MTLIDLAQKHNLEPESAKAFLLEWLDTQTVMGYQSQGYGIFEDVFDIPLIARPTDLGE